MKDVGGDLGLVFFKNSNNLIFQKNLIHSYTIKMGDFYDK